MKIAVKPPIQLFTTQLVSSQARLEGLTKSVQINSKEQRIETIFVLSEGLDPSIKEELEGLYPKLRLLPCNKRPDFSILIQAAIDEGNPDALTIICNSDIWFDLQRSDLTSISRAFEENPDLVLTLTRRQDNEPIQLLTVDGVLPEFLSSDAWIFAGLPRPFPCHGICLGVQDMERLVNRTLQLEGYTLANACCWLRAIHMETSANNYKAYNHDWLQKTVLANPLLAAHGLPEARVVLPPCHNKFDMGDQIKQERFTPLWTEFTRRWILVDLCQTSFAVSEISLLWLLFFVIKENRFLIAYIDKGTDPEVIQLLDRCHQLTGRSLCIWGFSMSNIIKEPPSGDLCWVSSPEIISPEIMKYSIPLICISCKSQKPINRSWFRHFHTANSLSDQLQVLQPIDPESAGRLASSCANYKESFVSNWLTTTAEWCSMGAYAMAMVMRLSEAAKGKQKLHNQISSLSTRPGFILQINDTSISHALKAPNKWMKMLKKFKTTSSW